MTEACFAGRYRNLGLLGEGGMGRVWRVLDEHDGQELALKTHFGVDDAERRLAFRQEFQALARLRHPNTVAVQGYGELADGTPYFTMELVPGQDLDARGPLSLEAAYPILLGSLHALAFIHDRGMVHRDLKPANVRLRADGVVKLMDFGLMAPIGTTPRGISGTPAYMAPEAIRGEALGPASDLYAWGCLAYTLFAGVPPFEGETREVLAAHLREAPLPLRAFRPDLPERLEALVAALLAKEPARRPAGADEAIAALAELAGLDAARPSGAQRRSYLVAGTLVGREAELERLSAAWKAARGGLVLVAAAGGLGKSRLLDELLVQAMVDGAPTVRVVCPPEGAAPYALWAETVRALEAALGPAPAAVTLHLGPAPAAGAGTGPELGRALAAWLADAPPLLLALDDLHRADAGSLAALAAYARAPGASRALLLATVRPDELAPTHPLRQLAAEGCADWLELSPFGRDGVAALLRAMLGPIDVPADFLDALEAATGGSPFALGEVLRDLVDRGLLVRQGGRWQLPPTDVLDLPADAAAAVVRRAERLPPQARALAELAAVLGPRPTRTALLALSGLDEDTHFAALDALAGAQLLFPEADALRFAHDRVREALYAATSRERRRELHGRCAAYLAAQGARPGDVGAHYEAAGEPERAWPYMAAAADLDEAAGVPLGALAWRLRAERCLAECPDADPAELARLRWQAGLAGFNAVPLLAIPPLERLAAEPGGPDPLDVELILTAAYGFAGMPARARDMAARAAARLPDPAAPMQAAWLTVQCAGWLAAGHVDAIAGAARRVRELLARADLTDQPPLVARAQMAMRAYDNACAYQGQRPDAATAEAAAAMAVQLGAAATAGVIRHYEGLWLAWSGRADELDGFLAREERQARSLGGPPYPVIPYLRAYLAYLRGEPQAALALVERARRMGATAEPVASYLDTLEARLLAATGEPAVARLESVVARARAAGLDLAAAHALLALAELVEPADALPHLDAVLELVGPSAPARNPLHHLNAARLKGEALLALGRPEEATRWLAEAGELLVPLDLPLQQGELELARAAFGEDSLGRAAACFRAVGSLSGLHAVQQALARRRPAAEAPTDDWDELEALLGP